MQQELIRFSDGTVDAVLDDKIPVIIKSKTSSNIGTLIVGSDSNIIIESTGL
ncbi:hypothetical protein ES705_18780 [subsurface metagenome]